MLLETKQHALLGFPLQKMSVLENLWEIESGLNFI
jgi:hypothetical protein